jgi:hypothetical protein
MRTLEVASMSKNTTSSNLVVRGSLSGAKRTKVERIEEPFGGKFMKYKGNIIEY